MPILFIQVVWTQPAIFPRYACMSDLFELINESLVWAIPIYFILLSALHNSLDLSSLTRDGTWAPGSGSTESSPLDHQGIPSTNITESAPFSFLENFPHSSFGWLCFQLKYESVPYVSYELVVNPKAWLYSDSTFRQGYVPGSVLYWCLVVPHQEG